MSFKSVLSLYLVFAFACVVANTTSTTTRDLKPEADYSDLPVRLQAIAEGDHSDLYVRLQADGGLTHCWNALSELRSCTNEILLFFVNGKATIGSDCCQAIEVITKNCWPAMLTSLGFTAEEGNILRGYCDASQPMPSGPAPSPFSDL